MAFSLAQQAMQKLPLQTFIKAKFNNVPYTDQNYLFFLDRLDPRLREYYWNAEIPFQQFTADIQYIASYQSTPLVYDNLKIYWFRRGNVYVLYYADSGDSSPDEKVYTSLDPLIGEILFLIQIGGNQPYENRVFEAETIPENVEDILRYMLKQNQDKVEELYQDLLNDSIVSITDEISMLGIFPISELINGYIFIDGNRLIAIGFGYNPNHLFEMEEKDTIPIIAEYTSQDIQLVLSTLIYNPGSYDLEKV